MRLFRIDASPYWYVRVFMAGRMRKRSTRETEKSKAIAFAKRWWTEQHLAALSESPIDKVPLFNKVALQVIEEDAAKVARGERAANIVRDGKQLLRKHVEPYFHAIDVRDVKYPVLSKFVNELSTSGLAAASIKATLVFVRKVLKHAMRMDLIDRMPLLPTVTHKPKVRGWFSMEEYIKLRKTARDLARRTESVEVRHTVIDDEIYLFIMFMVNTFMRPSDVKLLQHKHIETVTSAKENPYLRINTPFSKTENTPIISMQAAVPIYKKLCALQESKSELALEKYLFLPRFANRDHALEMLRRQFNVVLEESNLKTAGNGAPRTIYSLRHTAIMLRLVRGDKVDLITLARNARTSVEMIDRFYAKHLTPEMNVKNLQSMRAK